MRYSLLIIIFVLHSCAKNDVTLFPNKNCEYIHSIGLSVEPMSESALVNYSFFNPANSPIDPSPDPELSCEPETIVLLVSKNEGDYEEVATLEDLNGSYLIEGLEDCDIVSVRIEGRRSDLNTVFAIRSIIVGDIPLPVFMNTPHSMEKFSLADNEDQFVYRSTSDDWYLSSFGNQSPGQLIFRDVYTTRWNPSQSNKIAGVEYILVPVSESTNGISSKFLVEYDLDTGTKEVLHEIENHMDYNYEVYNPELYWIQEFYYGLDGQSIYFMSNKDNGGSSTFDQRVYDNIWKIDLATKEIEPLSDLLPLGFDLVDFVEDPKQEGNFYITGGERDVEVESNGISYTRDLIDIHYYNSSDRSITPILVNEEEKEYLSIDPTGDNLVFTTTVSGLSELRSFNLTSQKQKQLTYSDLYKPIKRIYDISWVSENEFITVVRRDGESNLATFRLD